MLKKLTLSLALLLVGTLLFGQRITREEYILKYKTLAIQQAEKYGIPASIKMAQALLESDNGNSTLAEEANNHFGLKCKSDWEGDTYNYDDDSKNECFRKYISVVSSYTDHSEYLDNSPRYDELFKLDIKDYKGWAAGLKKAGYATNPVYPELLIKIIEDNRLYLLDDPQTAYQIAYKDIKSPSEPIVTESTGTKVEIDDYNVSVDRESGRQVRFNNGIEYVLADKGDTYYSIASDMRINRKLMLKFNDLKETQVLSEGDLVYIKEKAKRSENGHLLYVIEADETMYGVSQKFGIRLKNLYRINNMHTDQEVKEGVQIRLR